MASVRVQLHVSKKVVIEHPRDHASITIGYCNFIKVNDYADASQPDRRSLILIGDIYIRIE